MKTIVLVSDIHNNLEALNKFIKKNAGNQIICLGDIVGYNENFDPNLSVEEVKRSNIYSIAGNWDRMVNMKEAPGLNYNGDTDFEKKLLKEQEVYGGTVPNNKYYTQSTKNALESIIKGISQENKDYLNSLKDTHSVYGIYYFVHGGFHKSQLKNGLKESSDFNVKQFNYNAFIKGKEYDSQLIPGKIIVLGHTHNAAIFYEGNYEEIMNSSENTEFEIENDKGAVISLPSLGRKIKENEFNGYALMKASKKKTQISFLKI
ncbi:MAG: metallophosphoesterase family protein [Candidatus Nanoarchaeia archaeon]|jgi:predicted phosphodiesterase